MNDLESDPMCIHCNLMVKTNGWTSIDKIFYDMSLIAMSQKSYLGHPFNTCWVTNYGAFNGKHVNIWKNSNNNIEEYHE